MSVGFLGLGKLGLPVATTMAARGLEVFGYDPEVGGYPDDPSYEEGFAEKIHDAGQRLHFTEGVEDVVANASVIFCAVPTPHLPRFEGATPIPTDRGDFDYSFLREVARQVNGAAERLNRQVTLAVISTVLPETIRREVRPLLHSRVALVYNPSFIAMGTAIRDFLHPEFVLLGGDPAHRLAVRRVYDQVLYDEPARYYQTSLENAELIKVAYNTFIGLKLAFANTLMEVCHQIPGASVDSVTEALKLADRRLISPAYLDGGMGDGGGCHPRDNIALSWLARRLDLSHDLFDDIMRCREEQTAWLVDLMCEYDLPKGILGIAYKPGSHITTGSPAALARHQLAERGYDAWIHDPHVIADHPLPPNPRVWLVGCNHPEWPVALPEGSVVIDPWRTWPDREGIEVVPVGVGP